MLLAGLGLGQREGEGLLSLLGLGELLVDSCELLRFSVKLV